ncbi:hypothetical protein SAMN05216428_10233 [Nitrosospira sp. Nsp11]|nr:hypothetical protein SAMN05216428_10233 [Nitrosospira sp. Nsp11]
MLFRPMIEMLLAGRELRCRVYAGLNQGKARNAITRAAFSTTGVISGTAASRKVTVQLAGRNHFMLIAAPVRSVG